MLESTWKFWNLCSLSVTNRQTKFIPIGWLPSVHWTKSWPPTSKLKMSRASYSCLGTSLEWLCLCILPIRRLSIRCCHWAVRCACHCATKLPLLTSELVHSEVQTATTAHLECEECTTVTLGDLSRELGTKWEFPSEVLLTVFDLSAAAGKTHAPKSTPAPPSETLARPRNRSSRTVVALQRSIIKRNRPKRQSEQSLDSRSLYELTNVAFT